MKRLSTFLSTLLVVAGAVACSSSPTDPSVATTLTLAPSQSGAAGNLTLKFIGVIVDSRCPGDAICIAAGDAAVAVQASLRGATRGVELMVNHADAKRADVSGYLVEVEELTPYPFASQGPISPDAYRLKLRVTR
jgi:hypothetical protein